MFIGCLQKEQNNLSSFLSRKHFLTFVPFEHQADSDILLLLTSRSLQQPRPHTCGILHRKCDLAPELSAKPDQLSGQSKVVLVESLDFSHFLLL